MLQIFQFIFSCLKKIFNFLDFQLPGISLTFIDFFLLVLIIPMLFRLLKGSVSESGNDTIFGFMDGLGGISNTASLNYKNYLNNKYSSQLVWSSKYHDLVSSSKPISTITIPKEVLDYDWLNDDD